MAQTVRDISGIGVGQDIASAISIQDISLYLGKLASQVERLSAENAKLLQRSKEVEQRASMQCFNEDAQQILTSLYQSLARTEGPLMQPAESAGKRKSFLDLSSEQQQLLLAKMGCLEERISSGHSDQEHSRARLEAKVWKIDTAVSACAYMLGTLNKRLDTIESIVAAKPLPKGKRKQTTANGQGAIPSASPASLLPQDIASTLLSAADNSEGQATATALLAEIGDRISEATVSGTSETAPVQNKGSRSSKTKEACKKRKKATSSSVPAKRRKVVSKSTAAVDPAEGAMLNGPEETQGESEAKLVPCEGLVPIERLTTDGLAAKETRSIEGTQANAESVSSKVDEEKQDACAASEPGKCKATQFPSSAETLALAAPESVSSREHSRTNLSLDIVTPSSALAKESSTMCQQSAVSGSSAKASVETTPKESTLMMFSQDNIWDLCSAEALDSLTDAVV